MMQGRNRDGDVFRPCMPAASARGPSRPAASVHPSLPCMPAASVHPQSGGQ